MRAGSPPMRRIASRIAARSTPAGTPVKSWSSTRAGMKGISRSEGGVGSHASNASMCSRVTRRPSSPRSRFSSRILSEKGSRAARAPSASRRWTRNFVPPTSRTPRVRKLSPVLAMQPRYTAPERRSTGGAHPTYVTAPPLDPNRLFIVEQPGRIRLIKSGALQATAFLDIQSKVESGGTEQGLLSVAFHPDFENNGFFYVNYTSRTNGGIADGDTVVERYQATPTSDQADPLSAQLVFTVHKPFANHNGGLNLFGPDGMLYVGMGDGGTAGALGGDRRGDASTPAKL